MAEWEKVKLGDVSSLNAKTYSLSEEWSYVNYLDTGNITQNNISAIQKVNLEKDEKLPSRARRIASVGDILYSTVRPNQLHYGFLKATPSNFLVSTGFAVITPLKNIDGLFLYYVITQEKITETLQAIAEQATSTYPSIKPSDIADLEIPLPPLVTQKKIVRVLGALDDKIELNNQINHNLEEQAKVLFKSWFVDFEPFGGKMPEDWTIYKLGDFLPVITGKKNANISGVKGQYPFFSCSQEVAWTDDYSFDGDAILVAGNGDFNVKFYKGKFEAYQRTYVLIPSTPRYASWLYYVVKHNLNLITQSARGSVIKFITKGNLEDFEFAAPKNLADCEIIDVFSSVNNAIFKNRQENYRLAELRDTLLPKLMSGEIDIEKVKVENG